MLPPTYYGLFPVVDDICLPVTILAANWATLSLTEDSGYTEEFQVQCLACILKPQSSAAIEKYLTRAAWPIFSVFCSQANDPVLGHILLRIENLKLLLTSYDLTK